MKKLCFSLIALLFVFFEMNISLNAQVPDWVWAKSGGGSSQDQGNALCIDNNGNVLITGYFSGTATFGDTTINSVGNWDFFLAKYDQSGKLLWIRNSGGTNSDFATAVTTDSENNIYVTGQYAGDLTIGSYSLDNYSSTYDIFIAKYNRNGNVVWAKKIGSTGADEALAITTDKNDNLVITGSIQPTAYFDSISITNSDLGSHTMFVAKYTSSGKILFVDNFGGHMNFANCVAVDNNNNIIVGGRYDRSVTIGGKTYTSQSSFSPILIKLHHDGNVVWVDAPVCSGGTNSFNGIAIGPDNNIFLTGSFENNMKMGLSVLVSSGMNDGFICKYNSSGTITWGHAFGGTDKDEGFAVSCNANQVAVTGFSKIISGKGTDVLLNIYGMDGSMKLNYITGGLGNDNGRSIKTDMYGNSYLAGEFTNNMFFGTLLLSGQGTEVFMAKLEFETTPSIVIYQHPVNENKCLGENATFIVSASGTNLKYQWKHNGTDIPGKTDTFLYLDSLDMSDAGKYSCKVSDSASDITSDEATLSVGVGPMITAQPQDKIVEKGKAATFTISATGNQLSYKWQKNGQDIDSANLPTYSINNVQYSDSGLYRCIVLDGCGIDTSVEVKLSVIHNTGFNENDNQLVSIYPNPAGEFIHIQINKAESEIAIIRILTPDGKLVTQKEISCSPGLVQILNLQGLTKGIYFVKISSQSILYTKLLFKN